MVDVESRQVMSPHGASEVITGGGRRLPVFSGRDEDWGEWSFKFEAVAAQVDGLLKAMDQGAETETDGDTNEALAKLSKRLYYDLAACMKGDGIRVMRRAPKGDGIKAWSELQSKYASNAGARKAMLMARLYEEARPQTEEDVERYIDTLEDIRRQLEDIGVIVEGEMLLGRIKRSLPSSFRPLLAALQLQRSYVASGNEYTYVIDEIKLWCQQTKMDRSERRDLPHGEKMPYQTAYAVHRNYTGQRALECYYCLGPHKKDACALFKRDQDKAIKEAAGSGGRTRDKNERVQTVNEVRVKESLF